MKIAIRLALLSFVLAALAVAIAVVFYLRSGNIWSDFYNDHDVIRRMAFWSPLAAAVTAIVALIFTWREGWACRALASAALLCCGASLFISALLFDMIDRGAPPEATAASSLRTLHVAIDEFASAHERHNFPASLRELGCDPHAPWAIYPELAAGSRFYYRYTYVPRSTHGDGKLDAYQILADPDPDPAHNHGYIPHYHFFMDESGTLHISRNGPATAQSEPL